MKINDLRKLSDKDLLSRLVDNKESLQKYRFQKSIQQLEDYKVLSDLRRENARINTILREKTLDKENIDG
ncbi:MAG TPA: 50S ribosomal protein L29 [Candidatus Marinimicrobia bacterium]|nr:50S ribosomal protein L29 [Candidatus Neomarinimicrobiota bacterium]|tara:strand:- start:3904 stop:4113 length:210 start_codon:yes stop_codon:yes gene_type:complete